MLVRKLNIRIFYRHTDLDIYLWISSPRDPSFLKYIRKTTQTMCGDVTKNVLFSPFTHIHPSDIYIHKHQDFSIYIYIYGMMMGKWKEKRRQSKSSFLVRLKYKRALSPITSRSHLLGNLLKRRERNSPSSFIYNIQHFLIHYAAFGSSNCNYLLLSDFMLKKSK